MSSIYRRALGADFDRLHPKIQERFGFSSEDGLASIGRGIMESIWHGPFYVLPFLYIGAWRRILFPEHGVNIPFTVENYAYRDTFGRETISWIRRFETPHPRRFDAYMIFSEQRDRLVDYLGTHQHLVVDIQLSVDDRGGLRLRSNNDRIYEGIFGFRFPRLFTGEADVCEWYDEEKEQYCIEVNVSNPWFGPLFGYRGYFQNEWHSVSPHQVPVDIRPRREERRE
jgi:hypothetical protein